MQEKKQTKKPKHLGASLLISSRGSRYVQVQVVNTLGMGVFNQMQFDRRARLGIVVINKEKWVVWNSEVSVRNQGNLFRVN